LLVASSVAYANLCPQATSFTLVSLRSILRFFPQFRTASWGNLRSSEERVRNNDYDKMCALLGCYAASSGTSIFGFLFGYFNLACGPIGCPETSVIRKYHYSLRSNPEERSSLLLPSGSLKSRTNYDFNDDPADNENSFRPLLFFTSPFCTTIHLLNLRPAMTQA
jgi:hypothetical protein